MNHSTQSGIKDFMHQHPMAVIATHANGALAPESALIAFVELDDLSLVFETFSGTRKHHNIQANAHVSLVIGWDINIHKTLQYEGVASFVEESNKDSVIELFKTKDTPCTEVFLRNHQARFFMVKPTWLRYSDYTKDKPIIIEESF